MTSRLDGPWTPEPGDPGPAALLASVHRHHTGPAADALITRAWQLAARAHAGQRRKSGQPYIVHPLAVATHVAELGADLDAIAAAVLHDTVEDTPVTLDDLEQLFGPDIAAIVDGVTKLDRAHVPGDTLDASAAASLKKMIVALASDVRVLVVKLCDRLHNAATLDAFTAGKEPGSVAHDRGRAKQRRIADETLQVYVPLAARLGLWSVKARLEDLAFAQLHPELYQQLAVDVARRTPDRDQLIATLTTDIRAQLADAGLEVAVHGRTKTLWSTHRKMVEQGRTLDEIFDLAAVRIICDDVTDCYTALGQLHATYPPLPGQFTDYIAMPKFNTYQSLHTKLAGPGGRVIEAQIRTHDMHVRADLGIAAHWQYKQPDTTPGWVTQLLDRQAETDDATEFLQLLKADLVRDEVFVLTRDGDIVTLPSGATALDLAYHIHTQVGHRSIGVRVDGAARPLRAPLPSGARVEIVTDESHDTPAGPRPDWLDAVVTARARHAIRTELARRRRARERRTVRRELALLLAEHGLAPDPAHDRDLLATVAADLGYDHHEALLDAVAEDNDLTAAKLAAVLLERHRPDGGPAASTGPDPTPALTVTLTALDRVGLIAELAARLAEQTISIVSLATATGEDRLARLTLTIAAGRPPHTVTDALRPVAGVVELRCEPAA